MYKTFWTSCGLLLFAALSIFGWSILGCGGGDEWTAKRPKVYPALRRRTLDGKPLAGANVIYHSQSQRVSAQGITDANGDFRLTTYQQDDGAVEGT